MNVTRPAIPTRTRGSATRTGWPNAYPAFNVGDVTAEDIVTNEFSDPTIGL